MARELESEDFGPALDARLKLVALATYAVSSSPLIFGPVNTQLSNLHAILANPLLTPADRVSNLFRELLQLFQLEDKRLSPRLLDEPLVRSEIIQMTEHYGNALLFHDNAKLRRLLVIDFLEALLEQRDALIPWIHDAEAIDPLANLLAIIMTKVNPNAHVLAEANLEGPHLISRVAHNFLINTEEKRVSPGRNWLIEYSDPFAAYLEQLHLHAASSTHDGIVNVKPLPLSASPSPGLPPASADIIVSIAAPHVAPSSIQQYFERASNALQPGGLVATIAPATWLFRDKDAEWRSELVKNDTLSAACLLDKRSANQYGSNQAALILLERSKPSFRRGKFFLVDASHAEVSHGTNPRLATAIVDALGNPIQEQFTDVNDIQISIASASDLAINEYSFAPNRYRPVQNTQPSNAEQLQRTAATAKSSYDEAAAAFEQALKQLDAVINANLRNIDSNDEDQHP